LTSSSSQAPAKPVRTRQWQFGKPDCRLRFHSSTIRPSGLMLAASIFRNAQK
jgi:hypothetical protein